MRPTPARFILLISFRLKAGPRRGTRVGVPDLISMWTGAILAGGHARRLGGLNKAGLILQPGGASLLDRQLARLRRVVDRTIIIANDAERVPAPPAFR